MDYALGGHPLWELFRAVYQMTKNPMSGGLSSSWVCVGSRSTGQRPVSRELVESADVNRWDACGAS